MPFFQKIYFSFLVFFSLIIIGVSLYYGLNNDNKITNKNNSLHNAENQQTLSFLETRIKELEAENQQKIKEAEAIQKQDELLNNQIRLKIDQLRDYMVQLGDLEKEIQAQEEELKKEALTPEERTNLETKIKALKDTHTEIKTKKNQLNQEALTLTEERKALTQKKNETQKTLNHQKVALSQVTQFKELEKEINDLTEAMNYNEAEKQQIKTLLKQYENNEEETKKLKNYQLFLDKQLLSFDQRIKKINQMIAVLKNPQLVPEKKKPKTFQNVYGMDREKAELRKLVHYFKADKHVLGYQNVRPMGVLLYGPPGTGKSHLIEAFCGETGTHFIELEPSRLDKTYVGEGNEELEKIWDEAESHEKSVIFIDEISGLANREDKNANQTANNIINNLLTKLDGFKRSNKKILLMGATNHLEKIDSALRSRFQQEIKIDSFQKEEIPGFLQFLILQNNYRISYHTFHYLTTLVNRSPQEKAFSNRDWVKLLTEAFLNYDLYSYYYPQHEVMLPSDLDEALEIQIEQPKTLEEMKQRREACENQYKEWKEGLLKYFTDQKDMTPVKKTYIFSRFNGLDQCQYKDKVPKDLPLFIREPFNNWRYTGEMKPYNDSFMGRAKNYFKEEFRIDVYNRQDSKFYPNCFLRQVETIEMDYEGPKYLLEEDKDFYINTVECPLQEHKKFDTKHQNYYLHFNPVKQYITLYTEKMNVKDK